MNTPEGNTLRFERFEVDPARRQVRLQGRPVELGARAFEVLLTLARHADRVVTKAELLDTVWPGLVVEENNLTVQVVALRKALGADAISTVPGRGYQLTAGPMLAAPVPSVPIPAAPMAASAASEGRDTAPTEVGAAQAPRIAVLPFTNMSGEPAQEYFADGIVDNIITALARSGGPYQVIARSSSFVYKGRAVDIKQVGIDLGVRYVLEGSVQASGARVRIQAQLIDAGTGGHLWADRFDGALEDLFDLQDRVTEQVLTAIWPQVLVAEIERAHRKPTNDLKAYDLLMRAGSTLGFSSAPAQRYEAQLLLEQALARDPRFSVAKALLATLHMQRLADGLGDVHDVRVGVCLAEEALADHRDDPSTLALAAIATAMLGIRLMGVTVIGFRYDHAMAAVSRALALAPNVFLVPMAAGTVHLCVGDADAAIAHFEHARRLDPIGPDRSTYTYSIAAAQFAAGRYEQCLATTERAILEGPRSTAAHRMKTIVLGQLGRAAEAKLAAWQLLELTPKLTVSRYLSVMPVKDAKLRKRCGALLKSAGIPA